MLLVVLSMWYVIRSSRRSRSRRRPGSSSRPGSRRPGCGGQVDYDAVEEIEHFLSDAECDEIMALASTKLVPSRLYAPAGDTLNAAQRTSDQAWLYDTDSPLIKRVSDRVAELTCIPVERQEALQVVRYKEGGHYQPHYDACFGDEEHCERMRSNLGPRRLTVLLYLNSSPDDFEGGETVFPKLGHTVLPLKGNAAVFYNSDEKGVLLEQSLHGGNRVTRGEKWVCNKWVH
jgi:prolyl 4-hydroxylase